MSWSDLTPSKRCDWIDQLRGWAVIVMIEVHVVNVYLMKGMIPGWLNYVNGLVAPSFILCAGYSLVLSTFKPDGTLRPFAPTAKRLGFILLCAYLLHAPGLTLADWTVLSTPQKLRELFKIDVLQCIAISLFLLQGMARLVRKPMTYAALALAMALTAAWAAPHLWQPGVAEGWWMPLRGLFNGNADRGVTALFPLFPWFSFAAFGSVLGALYRHFRVMPQEGRARWSEAQWLFALGAAGVLLVAWGSHAAKGWLWDGQWLEQDIYRLHNTTLPSVAERIGVVMLLGTLVGGIELVRGRWKGPNLVEAASRESLLLYMLHLFLIFGLMLADPIKAVTGWGWYTQGWTGTLLLTAGVIGVNLMAGLAWQKARSHPERAKLLQRRFVGALGIWFLVGGWLTFFHFRKSPELATEPYGFLPAARARKGLPPTPDGLSRDPMEAVREKQRRRIALKPEEQRLLESQGHGTPQ